MHDVSLTDIQYFMVKEVKASTSFASLATTLLGKTFTFFRGSDLSKDIEVENLPYFVAHKFNSQDNKDQDYIWIVQFIIGIASDSEPTTDTDGIIIYESTDNAEKLAREAIKVIKEGIRSGGLNGNCNIHIADYNIIITEVGEALDTNAIVTLRFEDYKQF